MRVVGRRAQNGVNGLFLLQHLAEILVVGAAEAGLGLAAALFDFGLQRQAPAGPAIPESAQVDLLRHVTHGDDLGVLLVEQAAGVDASLSAGADDRDIDLLARRHEFRPAQHRARHQRLRGGRGSRLEKLPTGRSMHDLRCLHDGISRDNGVRVEPESRIMQPESAYDRRAFQASGQSARRRFPSCLEVYGRRRCGFMRAAQARNVSKDSPHCP